MKRTPWLSWRLYFLTIPIDVIVLLLSGDHASTGSNDFFNWAILSLLAHASIAPVTAIALFFTSKIDSWKAELFALVILGAVRGIAINIGFGILNLEPRVEYVAERLGDQSRTTNVSERAARILGYKPETTIVEGLTRQINWQKAAFLPAGPQSA